MNKSTIKVVRPFYRDGEIQKKDSILRDIPAVEALGYVKTGKAVYHAVQDAPRESPKSAAKGDK